jgi:hypothetical protein
VDMGERLALISSVIIIDMSSDTTLLSSCLLCFVMNDNTDVNCLCSDCRGAHNPFVTSKPPRLDSGPNPAAPFTSRDAPLNYLPCRLRFQRGE